MPRAYELAIYPPKKAPNAQPKPLQLWTTHPSGVYDPNALEIQFDITNSSAAASKGSSTITVAGIGLDLIQQSQQFAGLTCSLKGGMQGPGLPLESPNQYGVLMEGQIIQSFGNWTGTDQNLSFVVNPSAYNYYTGVGNFTFYWPKNTRLDDAIKSTLQNAFPDLGVFVEIANTYVSQAKFSGGHYRTLSEFSQFLQRATKTATSPGVSIYPTGNNTIIVRDTASALAHSTKLQFNDLIGQPAWNQPYVMQAALVLRGDIIPGTSITMPAGLPNAPGAVATSSGATSFALKYKPTFAGNFGVSSVRHIGNSRDPNPNSWTTVLECFTPTQMQAK